MTKSDDWNEEFIHEIMSKVDPLVPTERLDSVYPTIYLFWAISSVPEKEELPSI